MKQEGFFQSTDMGSDVGRLGEVLVIARLSVCCEVGHWVNETSGQGQRGPLRYHYHSQMHCAMHLLGAGSSGSS